MDFGCAILRRRRRKGSSLWIIEAPHQRVPVDHATGEILDGRLDPLLERRGLVGLRLGATMEKWKALAPHMNPRTYHCTAVLLPDGRVFSAGGDTELGFVPTAPTRMYEIYHPPYLFRGDRPTITDAPDALTYGEKFRVATPDAAEVAKVVLVRHASGTHSFDFDQRLVELEFKTRGGTELKIESPAGPTIAPPGWYMRFLLDADGVPSVGQSLRMGPA